MKKVLFLLALGILLTACTSNVTVKEAKDLNNNKENKIKEDKIMVEKNMTVTMKTNKGDIELELYQKEAPITVANFLKLIKEGFYDDIKFHRVISNFMIQTGDPNTKGEEGVDFVYDSADNPNNLPIAGTGGPGYKFEDEFNNGFSFDKMGVLAMANSGSNTNGSQIFITHVATPHLNNKHTIFGQVVHGQDIVEAIEQKDYIMEIIINQN
ncbi:peptidylprolyl isomerase [bacterium]|nr:peptidylprolyl isomerase [bacterium]